VTPAELKILVENIVTEVNGVADIAAGVDPALVPLIAIGKAVDKMLPGLVESVDNWIQGNPPTDEEKANLTAQLAVLNNPDLP
jgi:hypothetical protein